MDNIEKNKYVKKEITTALLNLLKEKNLEEITVSEITSKAQVGRVSFYRNYKNKEDILKQYLLLIIKEWENKNSTKNLTTDNILKCLFEHLITNKDFYTLLYQKKLFYLFRNTLKQIIIKDKIISNNVEAYAIAFVSYGIYGWIEEWLARGMQESADEIYTILKMQAINK
ncbi:TetR/AcrR family transcriptional regulator [Thomasclavelia cocleata]|uniref:DNA-binding transcriptional regulator, AcrR family n=3 Tax=Thomasclavelia cocleata TaxID=69824 RepID=A0A1I0EHD5_9FIRM|nr:TetR/AcrR family transcriptional regulator [Thomasclavelia cocleata]MCR1959344.1 TetR/AcrR family transcriptional regulator [Thomasclavelia cocleata]NDO42371.1 TetR/AcrR family transcriptional regulator [Thomasclavelia cocleata]SET44327.1 DNA-binding transcriptional regulator, AcrR family [Thomasclavelia cocleata]